MIIVDNLHIGGFQRLALDQAYQLIDLGVDVEIVVMSESPNSKVPNFYQIEMAMINEKGLVVRCAGQSRIKQIRTLAKLAWFDAKTTIVLSHSLRAVAILFLVNLRVLNRLKVFAVIHQLPTLSKNVQRGKRFLFAQMCNSLFCYSVAVKRDWETRLSIFKPIKLKSIEVLRNGVYLNRLPIIPKVSDQGAPRLIFLGRDISWKGVQSLVKLAESKSLSHFDLLFMVPDANNSTFVELPEHLKSRTEIVSGKTISLYKHRRGDVHLYPVNYGPKAKYIESVSLNCIEFACLGVPTVLTSGGLETWPEIKNSSIFLEVDWGSINEVEEKILSASAMIFSHADIDRFRKLFSIENQMLELLERANRLRIH